MANGTCTGLLRIAIDRPRISKSSSASTMRTAIFLCTVMRCKHNVKRWCDYFGEILTEETLQSASLLGYYICTLGPVHKITVKEAKVALRKTTPGKVDWSR